jgi:hypothetical protein
MEADRDMINAQMMPSILPMVGGAGIEFVGVSAVGRAISNTSLALDVPTGVQPGDLLVLVASSNSTATNALIMPSEFSSEYVTSVDQPFAKVRSRIAGASEPSSYNVGASVSSVRTAFMAAFRNASLVAQIDAVRVISGSSSSVTTPTLTVDAGSLAMAVFLLEGSNYAMVSGPSEMTEIVPYNNSVAAGIAAYIEEIEASGVYSGRTATWTGASWHKRGIVMEIHK